MGSGAGEAGGTGLKGAEHTVRCLNKQGSGASKSAAQTHLWGAPAMITLLVPSVALSSETEQEGIWRSVVFLGETGLESQKLSFFVERRGTSLVQNMFFQGLHLRA